MKCKRCDLCTTVCPCSAIQKARSNACAKCIGYCLTMQVPCNPELYVIHYDLCDSCGLCVPSCPHEAIYWFTPPKYDKTLDLDTVCATQE
ncbi:MAG: 4Fe-4S binding protein [Lentimicrobiaceae bacterium]|nr:4Fe-4S binding protein [Lentimicrobiaceae bacterium]